MHNIKSLESFCSFGDFYASYKILRKLQLIFRETFYKADVRRVINRANSSNLESDVGDKHWLQVEGLGCMSFAR